MMACFSKIINTTVLLLVCLSTGAWAQSDSAHVAQEPQLKVGAYLDLYYGLTSAQQPDNNVPYFVSMSRSNELTVNLGFIDVQYATERFRARFAPALGTFMNANYAAEPGTLKNILEASAGFRLSKTKQIWLDAGILGSPYTNESAISRDHLMYTRSFAPEYVPYYLSGLKLSLPLGDKVTAYLYLLNGWQQIQDVNRGKSLGTQVEYRPNSKHLFNWNTYIGDERSAAAPQNRTRYFTDVFWIYNPDGVFSFTTCAYIGSQVRENAGGTRSNAVWWQTNFIGRYRFTDRLSLSGRVEYFDDPDHVQITPVHPVDAFASYSTGLCLNYTVNEVAMLRLEGRQFFSSQTVYTGTDGNPAKQLSWVIANITLRLP